MNDALSKLRQAQKEYMDRKMAAEWSASTVEDVVPMIGNEARAKMYDHISSALNTGKSAMIIDEDALRRLGRFDGIRELPPSEDTTISREERAKARPIKRLQSAGLTTTKE